MPTQKDRSREDRTREAADQAEKKAREAAERADENAREATGRAEDKAREAAERAEEKARRASERAAEKAERALEKTGRAQDRVARALDQVVEAEERAAVQASRAIERAERAAGGRGDEEVASIWMRAEPSSRRPSHTRADIAGAALEIADAEGFEAVSMRRVAQQLGAGTMTLYHYVRNKDELITLMFDAVMAEVLIPEEELTGGWRKALERIAIQTRETFRRHRWSLDRLGDGRPGPSGMRHFEQSLAAVADLDLPPAEKFELIGLIDDYVFGYSLREADELAEHERGWSEETLSFFQRELDTGAYPLMRDFLGDEVGEGIERVVDFIGRPGRFERGLERLLDGIEAHLESSDPSK